MAHCTVTRSLLKLWPGRGPVWTICVAADGQLSTASRDRHIFVCRLDMVAPLHWKACCSAAWEFQCTVVRPSAAGIHSAEVTTGSSTGATASLDHIRSPPVYHTGPMNDLRRAFPITVVPCSDWRLERQRADTRAAAGPYAERDRFSLPILLRSPFACMHTLLVTKNPRRNRFSLRSGGTLK